jgi:lipopolysaccharide transport system ATP-binding protein
MSEVLVKVEGVSKKFCRNLKRSLWYGVQDICADLNIFRGNGSHSLVGTKIGHAANTNGATECRILTFNIPMADHGQNGLRRDEFWAVNNVSFELKRGECLGLIGRNGAGKTTLLKMLNGLIKPDHGRIEMRGRVGALIALGAGFNPILTGRENIYVNGAVLGLTKREIDGKIEDIINFAEIREFIDSPVQSYSSGMQVRLGFAVATALEPDVLILDEVLAVGDIAFRNKCYMKISDKLANTAVIFVSHQETQIRRICTKVAWMDGGSIKQIGATDECLQKYLSDLRVRQPDTKYCSDSIASLVINYSPKRISYGDDFGISFSFTTTCDIGSITFCVGFVSDTGEAAAQCYFDREVMARVSEKVDVRLVVHRVCLRSGQYSINLTGKASAGNAYVFMWLNATDFTVKQARSGVTHYQLSGDLEVT